jgi:hypothetical protein
LVPIALLFVIELPELLSQKSNKFMKNPKSQEAKQTENVDDDNDDDDDNQEEEKSDEDESEEEADQNEEEGVYGKEGGDIDLSESDYADVDDDDFFGTEQKSLVKRFTPSDVVKPATYTPEEMSQNGVFALSANEQRDDRPLKLHGSELSQTLSTNDTAVYVNKNGRVHIGVRGTNPGSNLFETMSSVYNSSDKHSLTEMEKNCKKRN